MRIPARFFLGVPRGRRLCGRRRPCRRGDASLPTLLLIAGGLAVSGCANGFSGPSCTGFSADATQQCNASIRGGGGGGGGGGGM